MGQEMEMVKPVGLATGKTSQPLRKKKENLGDLCPITQCQESTRSLSKQDRMALRGLRMVTSRCAKIGFPMKSKNRGLQHHTTEPQPSEPSPRGHEPSNLAHFQETMRLCPCNGSFYRGTTMRRSIISLDSTAVTKSI